MDVTLSRPQTIVDAYDLQIGTYKKVRYRNDPARGIGVFAIEPIFKDELVEISATLQIPPHLVPLTDLTPLYDIVYTAVDGESDLVVFGNGSLYNHSHAPTLSYEAFMSADRHFVRFTARCDLDVGEELTINYYDDTANEPTFNLKYDPRPSRV